MHQQDPSHAAAHCDCEAHRRAKDPNTQGSSTERWGVLLPVLACAVCPACLTTYAKVFSVLGVGASLSDAQHTALLIVAVGASVGLSGLRTWRSRRVWPVATAGVGAGLVLSGHLAPSLHVLEWVGVLVLLVGGLREHFRLTALATSA